MRSVASGLRRDTVERVLAMNVAERIALALSLGDADVDQYVRATGGSPEEARRQLTADVMMAARRAAPRRRSDDCARPRLRRARRSPDRVRPDWRGGAGGSGCGAIAFDIDLLTTDTRVLDAGTWRSLSADVDIRRGDLDDPLAGVVRAAVADDRPIDVVVGRHAWQTHAVERAAQVEDDLAVLPEAMRQRWASFRKTN